MLLILAILVAAVAAALVSRAVNDPRTWVRFCAGAIAAVVGFWGTYYIAAHV